MDGGRTISCIPPREFDWSSRRLAEATMQEIQFELLRRSSFNALDGPKVVEGLYRYRDLWRSIIFDRIGFCGKGHLPTSSLIKLRDLPHNYWNADTLYILTGSMADARRLADIIREEDWAAEVVVHQEAKEIADLLGSDFREDVGLIRLWWD